MQIQATVFCILGQQYTTLGLKYIFWKYGGHTCEDGYLGYWEVLLGVAIIAIVLQHGIRRSLGVIRRVRFCFLSE